MTAIFCRVETPDARTDKVPFVPQLGSSSQFALEFEYIAKTYVVIRINNADSFTSLSSLIKKQEMAQL